MKTFFVIFVLFITALPAFGRGWNGGHYYPNYQGGCGNACNYKELPRPTPAPTPPPDPFQNIDTEKLFTEVAERPSAKRWNDSMADLRKKPWDSLYFACDRKTNEGITKIYKKFPIDDRGRVKMKGGSDKYQTVMESGVDNGLILEENDRFAEPIREVYDPKLLNTGSRHWGPFSIVVHGIVFGTATRKSASN